MAADLFLGAACIAQIVGHTVLSVRASRERERLVDAVVARHATDVAVMRRAESKAPKEPKPHVEPIEQIGL